MPTIMLVIESNSICVKVVIFMRHKCESKCLQVLNYKGRKERYIEKDKEIENNIKKEVEYWVEKGKKGERKRKRYKKVKKRKKKGRKKMKNLRNK